MWTEQENEIIKTNHGKITLPQIMNLLPNKHSYYSMRSHCQRMGLYRDKSKTRLVTNIKNKHNENYFESPNLVNSWMGGFIASDGCIMHYKNSWMFGLKLAIKDEIIIDTFMRELEYKGLKSYCSNKSPHSENISQLVYFRIACFDKNAANLEKYYNIVPQKTKRLGPTNLLDKNLNFAFVIGAIDGDGTVSMKKNKKNPNYDIPYLTLCSSSPHIIHWLKKIFDEHFPHEKFALRTIVPNVGYHKQDHFYRFTITGLRAAIVINYLSKLPVPKLARKWNNPEILSFIEQKKAEYPHLFIEPDQAELTKLLPEEKSVNISENKMEIQSLTE